MGDAENLDYLRFVAGAMLVRVWSTLRFDDTKAISPAAVQDLGTYIRFELERTKSTGPGRKRQLVYAYLSKAAFFVVPDWLGSSWVCCHMVLSRLLVTISCHCRQWDWMD